MPARRSFVPAGSFVSMATQVLVIFIIRTRKNPFRSRPNPWLIACSLTVVAVAALLPFTPAGVHFGFVAPPALFFIILVGMLILYLLAVEGMNNGSFVALRQSEAERVKDSESMHVIANGPLFGTPGLPGRRTDGHSGGRLV